MDFSRRTLSFLTVVVILGALAVAVWFRLPDQADGSGADGQTEAAAADGELPETSSSSQFSTDVPQPVTGAEVIRDTLWIRVTASGQAEAFRRAALSAQVEGVVTGVPVQENQRVAAGALLLQIDTTEFSLQVDQAKADLLAAEAEYRQLVLFDDQIADPRVREERERIARSRSGLEQGEVALRQAELRLARSHVTAPFPGRIADLRVVRGQNVPVSTELVTVVELDPIKVEVQVLEAELGYLREGRRAEVRFAAYPGEVFTGTVETINPVVDPETRTGRVTVHLRNTDQRIKPGMYAEVSLDAEALPDRILVPRGAILERGEGRRRTMLFVYETDGDRGLAKWRYVTTGRENETHVEILPGGEGMVEPGEMVLVDGHHYLAHDTPVRLVEDVAVEGGEAGAMKRTLVVAMLAAVCALPSGLRAQHPDSVTLTLDGALDIALGTNPAYRQAVNNAQLNGSEMRTTWFGQVLPQPQINLFSTAFTGNLTRRATDVFGNPVERPETDWTYFSQTTQSLDLTWRIQGASIFNALDRQRLVNLDRDVAETRALTEMGIAVKRAFWDAQEQGELLRAEDELVEARRTDQAVAERLFGLAMRSRVDVLNAELGVEQQALALRQQQAAFAKAKLALRTRLGDDELAPFRLAETPLPIFDPTFLEAETLVATAHDVNPELRQARVAIRSANVGMKESKRAWWPTLLLNFNVARRAQTPRGDALFDVSLDEDLDQRFYIGFQVPMFNDFFQNQQQIQQSSVDLANRRESERETMLRVEESVRGALLELESQWESLRLTERSAEIASEALRLAQEEYRIGTRTFEDLRQTVDSEADTRRQVIQARYAFVDALLSLEEAVGAPVGDTLERGR